MVSKVCFLYFSVAEIKSSRQGKNLEAGTEAKAEEEHCLRSSWLAQLVLLYNRGPLAQWWYCPQWAGPSHSIIDQEKAQQTCLETSLWRHFLGGASLFPGDPGLHQVDEKAASTYSKYLLHDLVLL